MATRAFVMIGNGRNRKSMAYVGNVSAFLAEQLAAGPGTTVLNYADKPDLTTGELSALVHEHLGYRPLLPFALPRLAGLLIGYAFDLLAWVTGRRVPISSARVRRFCAQTSVATDRLVATGFVPRYRLDEMLERTIQAEFGNGPPPLRSLF
jgi:nucleoside-diphosphate-sugar epimerase